MNGKVDTGKKILNNHFVLHFVSFVSFPIIDRLAVKVLIIGAKIFLKEDRGETNT